MSAPILSVRDLGVDFACPNRVVDGVSFDLWRGRSLALVGESGSGKTVTALSIMGLLDAPGRIVAGSIRYLGEELVGTAETRLRALRGNRLAMVFQEPATALNPVMRIGSQVAEPLVVHGSLRWRAARERAIELLASVGIPTPETNAVAYPHQLSGGMRQRITIAMALACAPDILIADEPTTALDTILQSQILALLRRLQHERDMAILFVTHDLSLVETVADDVMVMYAGRIVEHAPAARLVRAPRHPYASALWRASPVHYREGRRLYSIPGTTPRLPTAGCAFCERCERQRQRCASEQPELAYGVACFFPNDEPPDCHG